MRSLLLPTAIFFNGLLFAQDYNVKIFTTEDGLPVSFIYSIYFDSYGYMWMGSHAGFCRYDGRSFSSFSIREGLKTNVTGLIYEDSKHRLWGNATSGIYLFERNRFNEIPVVHKTPINYIFFFLELDDGTIVFSSDEGVFAYDGKKFEPYSFYGFPTGTVFRTIIKLPGKKLLANTNKAIYEKNENDKWEKLFDVSSEKIKSVYYIKYHKGKIYFDDYDGVYELLERQSVKQIFKRPDSLSSMNIFFFDRNDDLWMSTTWSGLYQLRTDGKIIHFGKNAGIGNYALGEIAEDRWGNIWAGSYQGLIRFSPSLVKEIIPLKEGDFFRNVYKSGEYIYFFGGRKDIYRYRMGHEEKFSGKTEEKIKNFLKGKYIISAAEGPDKRIWICTNAGELFILNNDDLVRVPIPVNVYQVGFEKNRLLLTNSKALYDLKNDQCRLVDSTAAGVPLSGISRMATDEQGRVWIGDNEKLMLLQGDSILNMSKSILLPATTYQQLIFYKNELWAATSTMGILRIKEKAKDQFTATWLNGSNGLSGDFVLSLSFDDDNDLWYTTTTGVYRSQLSFQDDSVHVTYTRKIGEHEGLFSNTIWDSGPLVFDDTGNIWVAANNGVFRINTHNIIRDTMPPVMQIEKVELTRGKQDWQQYTSTFSDYHNLPVNPKLSYRQNSLNIYFNGITMQNAQEVKYSYKLEGYDQQWSNANANQKAIYTNLPAGNYQFFVKAMNADGIWSKPDGFSFLIAPPFWQTWWFRTIVALGIISALYYFIRRREKIRVEKNQMALQVAELKLQTLQSQMNPHFIFNSLNSVQKYILEHNPAEGARYLSKFSKLIRMILDNSHHNLLPLHQIIETLEMYIELESLRFNKEFSYELIKDEDHEIMNRQLPPMLLQPFVENAIWHGLMPKEGEKKLFVSIQKKNGTLYCLIEDNGVGRKKAPVTDGHIPRGEKMIEGMTESLQQLLNVRSEIIITDLNGSAETTGTRVEIFIPDRGKK